MARWTKYMLVPFLLFWLVVNCKGGDIVDKTVQFHSIKDVPASSWEKLRQAKIFFGHQSVGNNIIEGMKVLGQNNPQVKLRIVHVGEPPEIDGPGFYQTSIGKNDHPISKIDAFTDYMDGGIGNIADIAFFKFCFVDITANTDIEKLFSYYSRKREQLKEKYPKTTFVHFTVPLLRRNKTSILDAVKKLIGKDDGFFADSHNIARNHFNELLRKQYKNKEPLFDLAQIESTFPDGSRCTFSKDGKAYYSLVPEYTKDGGHLNKLGQKMVAEQFLIFLAGLCK